MTEDDLKQFLEDNKADIARTVKAAAIEKLTSQYRWDVSEQISKVVNTFVAEHVIPEVNKELQAQKGPIVSAVIASLSDISDELAKALTKRAVSQLEGYNFRDVIKALFDVKH